MDFEEVDLVRDFNRVIDKLMEPGATSGDRKIAQILARSGVSEELMARHMEIREAPPLDTMTAREALLHGYLEHYGPHNWAHERLALPFYRTAADKGCIEAAYQCFTVEFNTNILHPGMLYPPNVLTPQASAWVIEEATKVASIGIPDAYALVEHAHHRDFPDIALEYLHKGIKEGSAVCAERMSRGKPVREKMFFLKMAVRLGSSNARDRLMHETPELLEPLGYWEPTYECNQWVYGRLHAEIKTLLLMSVRETTLFASLPRDVLYALCFWVSTGPRPGSETKKSARTKSFQQRLYEARKQKVGKLKR